jgi:hypothetical protein
MASEGRSRSRASLIFNEIRRAVQALEAIFVPLTAQLTAQSKIAQICNLNQALKG